MPTIPLDVRALVKLSSAIRDCDLQLFAIPRVYATRRPQQVADLLVPLVVECLEILKKCNSSELECIKAELLPQLRAFLGSDSQSTSETALLRIATSYVHSMVFSQQQTFKKLIFNPPISRRVLQVYPEIERMFDGDGLLRLKDGDFEPMEGGIRYKDHVFQYHPLFRATPQSPPNYDFLARFAGAYYSSNAPEKFLIAIDLDYLMSSGDYSESMRRSCWQGPTFSKANLDDELVVSPVVSVIARDIPEFDFLYKSVRSTEVCWSYERKTRIKTLEIEEISNPNTEELIVLNRYIHAERDTANKEFRHFDGSMNVYQPAEYQSRLTSKFPNEHRPATKIKLFRIDDDLGVEKWMDLIGSFYRGNEMILNYFDPDLYSTTYGEQLVRSSRG